VNLAHKLENDLIHRIGQIDNVNFLKAIQSILDSSDKEVFQLNELQENSIVESREELKNGQGIAHEEVLSDLKKWLKNG
jgi:hypothetical protein